MNYRKLPHPLQREILFFHHHKWSNSHMLDERQVISILPIPLQMDLSFEMLQPLINQFPVLTEVHTIVQKRISHALCRQVCPPRATIYNAGDIGWDIYFVGSGLVEITLPSNLNVLDEEGRANFSHVKEKAASVGLLYRPGNHFGESCLRSQSGVRQETVTAKTTAALYLISKENLERIFNFMGSEQKKRLKNNLISRNGNVWHSFESVINNSPDKSTKRKLIQRPRSTQSIIGKSDRFTLLQAQRSRRSMISDGRQKSRRRSTRLRSFSAEASASVIRSQIKNNFSTQLKQLSESDKTHTSISNVDDVSGAVRRMKHKKNNDEGKDSDTNNSDNDLSYMMGN